MYRKLCIANNVSQIMYRISCVAIIMYRISCIAYRVSHIMSRISCIAYPICKAIGSHGAPEATRGHGRPWEATGHRRPREATGGHGRPREATGGHGPHPTVPPKILYLLKWAGRGRQKGRLRRKPATGGNGGPRRGRKKVRLHQPPPFNILEDPYKLRQSDANKRRTGAKCLPFFNELVR